ncbi:GNAT family N-acetyltransferase [Maribacter chungangensis]|uniref:GNAT family N-acetyltransferase n=1 Tax=Maribacter chungangensis TaxID=1069117 RepID=A0ABW3B3P7_9FLAO
MVTIKQVSEAELEDILPLFNAYRLFYGQFINESAALDFLKDRLTKKESVIFLSYNNKVPVGFTQLYPTFSSVSLQSSLILNDLFVHKSYRNKGIAKKLLEAAKRYCGTNNYKGLALETATDNPAQYLYEKEGWQKDVHCFHYFWTAK